MFTAAVNTTNIHTEGHHNLEVRVHRIVVANADFNLLVADLNAAEVTLHLFLKNSVVQDCHSSGINGGEHVLVASPFYSNDTSSVTLVGSTSFPAVGAVGGVHRHGLAAPHDDVSIFSSSSQDTIFRIIIDRVNLVLVEKALESWLSQRQNIVFIRRDVKHADHVLTTHSSHEALASPNSAEIFRVSSNR
jgi:hypothetical protein